MKSGSFVLVVGPSGSGKDTLIEAAKVELRNDPRFAFPRRVITRPAMVGAEDHDTMSEEEFAAAKDRDAFALSWKAHGLSYGIPSASLDLMRAGKTVIVNVSRSVIGNAEKLGVPVLVISVLCRAELLAERIAARGRETKVDILSRLEREAPIRISSAQLFEVRNETRISDAAARFIGAIRRA